MWVHTCAAKASAGAGPVDVLGRPGCRRGRAGITTSVALAGVSVHLEESRHQSLQRVSHKGEPRQSWVGRPPQHRRCDATREAGQRPPNRRARGLGVEDVHGPQREGGQAQHLGGAGGRPLPSTLSLLLPPGAEGPGLPAAPQCRRPLHARKRQCKTGRRQGWRRYEEVVWRQSLDEEMELSPGEGRTTVAGVAQPRQERYRYHILKEVTTELPQPLLGGLV
mmetsp:Transcript_100572/g.322840  ORF Transcript_100572/g.322840 Transcript_100572/m.322840 type:complete len:222 (+) Transcript_100572:462-1127(+)